MIKRNFIILYVVLASLMMTSCIKARVKTVDTDRYEDKITYFQDQNTKAVFAIVVIKTGVRLTEDGIGLAYIPKDEVTPEIKSRIENYTE
jgi:ascorbate-specific PTS system EIIC-type component UlaA